MSLIVACVWTGTKYPVEYVSRLRSMVDRHLSVDHEFVCLTDRKDSVKGVRMINVSDAGLNGWWAKMALFDENWRPDRPVIYFDLDMIVVRSIDALAQVLEFSICRNFAREYSPSWPCLYGSCVMTIPANWGSSLWQEFCRNSTRLMEEAGKYGDQRVIEWLYPHATFLQEVLPKGFFEHYKRPKVLVDGPSPSTHVVVFGGSPKPHQVGHTWLREAWQ